MQEVLAIHGQELEVAAYDQIVALNATHDFDRERRRTCIIRIRLVRYCETRPNSSEHL